MYMINFISPEKAQTAPEAVQRIYSAFPDGASVPQPLQLLSASPVILEKQFEMIGYFMAHATLSFPVLAAIRYSVARASKYQCCTDYNSQLLQRCGMTLPDLDTMYTYAGQKSSASSPAAGLEERENILVRFVVQSVMHPQDTTKADLDAVRDAGWADQDIFEAVVHGTNMVSTSILDTVFRNK